MNTHAIAAALAAVSVSALAQPGATSFSSPRAAAQAGIAHTVSRAPGTLPSTHGLVLAKIDQNNTPPDRGGDPSSHRAGGKF
ncbi:hypothetical protein WJ32_26040 [Burkholderia ubonensis]|uniref:Uncharacterized protein n=1 Tax=Burkholderia ubonensis TaxID=101571 RepID=A0A103QPY2_9BURK|nr:hypothetical protein [Burkholderia ubonensis]AOJ65888.1 hypothetical protein WJ32_26040 [Burkholderia ubonensis]KVG53424.1 hypothetical protein WJ33_01520 [Burkholderia ubonensis]